MQIQYFKLISGEDVVAQTEDIDETSETITLLQPFVLSVTRSEGYHQYTSYRWNIFMDESYEDEISIKRNAIVFFGKPIDYVIDMYENWTKQEEIDPIEEEDMSEMMRELHAEYLKKVH